MKFGNIIAAVAMALSVASCQQPDGCPCGADTSDSFIEHDVDFSGPHNVDEECVCQCGSDTPYGVVRDQACYEYDGACVDSQGVSQALTCS